MEVLPERAPALAKLHPKVSQRETPGPRSKKSVNVEFAARHAGHSRGQRNERPDHWQQTRDEYSHVSPALKKSVSPVQFAAAHQNPASVTLDQRSPAIAANLIRDKRPKVASDRASRCRPHQLHPTGINKVAVERHDQFGRQRNARGLNSHEQRNTGIAGSRHNGINEDKK